MGTHPFDVDIAVLITFFNRPDTLAKVFEAVKRARPSRLYLHQDGPRLSRNDIEKIMMCRKVVSDIDWECEVRTKYHEENYGCDPSMFNAQKWFFDNEEYGIILEDDVVPAQAFFPYCKQLLEKYKHNENVHMVLGMNGFGVSEEIKDSYTFTKAVHGWGWASWKRVMDTQDPLYTWLENSEKMKSIQEYFHNKDAYEKFIQLSKKRCSEKIAYWEVTNGASQMIFNRVNIMPRYNMICNVGLGEDSTHSGSDIKLVPKRWRSMFYMKRHEISLDLVHPKTIETNALFDKVWRKRFNPGKKSRFTDKVETVFLNFRHLGVKSTFKKIKKHFI